MNKKITPMSRVSAQMALLRITIRKQGFKHKQLNKREARSSSYYYNYYNTSRRAVNSDHIEIFVKTLTEGKRESRVDYEYSFAVAFNYVENTSEKIVTISMFKRKVTGCYGEKERNLVVGYYSKEMTLEELKEALFDITFQFENPNFNPEELLEIFSVRYNKDSEKEAV